MSEEREEQNVKLFLELETKARQSYEDHPEYDLINTDPRVHQQRHNALQKSMRGQAICQILQNLDHEKHVYFAAYPRMIEDAEIYVVLGLERVVYELTPHLNTTYRDHMNVIPSLVHATVRNLLRWATRALDRESPGEFMNALGVEADEIVRGAASWFFDSIFYCSGQLFGNRINLFNEVSALPYEGRAGTGELILSKKGAQGVDAALELLSPVRLSNIRAARKLVEASGPSFSLLTDGEVIYGFGRFDAQQYVSSSESVFRIAIEGRGVWSVLHNGNTLFRVHDGAPRLPQLALDREYFLEVVERVLDGCDSKHLLELAIAVGRPEHGAMLVISSKAKQEARRLSSQAWVVNPANLSHDLITQLISIDGAILVDPKGTCHGIGVILDGPACDIEDQSRGSRYNNSVRYTENSSAPPAVIVVYSSDGSIDILPRLKPRVSRTQVAEAVERYQKAIQGYMSGKESATRGPRAAVADARDTIERYKFYLSQEQCNIVNSTRDAELEWSRQRDHIQILENDIVPDLRMNDSYFTD